MKAMEKDWYQKNWTLDIQNMSWVEDTSRQVDLSLIHISEPTRPTRASRMPSSA